MIRIFLLCLTGILAGTAEAANVSPPFRLHQSSEPSLLDPHRLRSGSSQFLLQNLHRGLLKHDRNLTPVGDLAESCSRSGNRRQVTCRLRPNLKWSDGTPLTASDFKTSFLRILDPKTQALRADLLFSIVGAEEFYQSSKGEPGIQALDARQLRFDLLRDDVDFEHKLTSVILTPFRPHGAGEIPKHFSGPYQIQTWDRGRRLRLSPNPFYPLGEKSRPDVVVNFIEDDGVAQKLFERGELDFLRRLPTALIPRFRGKPEFHWVSLLRFDYLGFGPRLKDRPLLRKALSEGLNYEELQTLFHSEGRPGCPGLPAKMYGLESHVCHPFDITSAKAAFSKDQGPKLQPLSLRYSAVGGEDHRRGAEWQQDQWRKHLGLTVNPRGLENKMFLSELKTKTPDVFRRGVSTDRPTCRALLEVFQTGHPEDYLQIKDQSFQKTLSDLSAQADPKKSTLLCQSAIRFLMENHHLIPLGEMHFAILANPKFRGWHLNALGVLDLSNLTPP